MTSKVAGITERNAVGGIDHDEVVCFGGDFAAISAPATVGFEDGFGPRTEGFGRVQAALQEGNPTFPIAAASATSGYGEPLLSTTS